MVAGLDEGTIVTLVAVLAGVGALALAAAFVLWRRERTGRAAAQERVADVEGGDAAVTGVEPVHFEPSVALKADVAATLQPVEAVADRRSEDGMSRVELFPIGARFAARAVDHHLAVPSGDTDWYRVRPFLGASVHPNAAPLAALFGGGVC